MFKTYARPIGYLALLGTILPPVLFMLGAIAIEPVKAIMLVAAIAWFIAAPFWMKAE